MSLTCKVPGNVPQPSGHERGADDAERIDLDLRHHDAGGRLNEPVVLEWLIVSDIAAERDPARIQPLIEKSRDHRIVQTVLIEVGPELPIDEEVAPCGGGVNADKRDLKQILESAAERIERSRGGRVSRLCADIAGCGADMDIPAADIQARHVRSDLATGKAQVVGIVASDRSGLSHAGSLHVRGHADALGRHFSADPTSPDAAAFLVRDGIGGRADEGGRLG